MSVLDAMGYGLPIVSTNVGGIPKIVHDGENGYCCAPGDIKTFSNTIIQLLKNEQFRTDAGVASLYIVEKSYSLEAHLQQLSKIYDSIG